MCAILSEGVTGAFMIGDKIAECIGGCKDCDNAETCNECIAGYYKNLNEICEVCQENCL